MKVLFVAGCNSEKLGIAPFIKVQGESLAKAGIDVRFFPVRGGSILGYLKASRRIRKELKENPVDIIHAHYVLCGWAAVLAFSGKPVVLSLLGSDVYGHYIGADRIAFWSRLLTVLSLAIQPFVRAIIVKSDHVRGWIYRRKICRVIPNGVDLELFAAQEKIPPEEPCPPKAERSLLFLGDKRNPRKNFALIEKALAAMNDSRIACLAPFPVEHDKVPLYLNAADVLLVPSFMEGSPNVVKEAMACNRPVVATDVGDVRWLFGDTEGYYLSSFDPQEFARKTLQALAFAAEKGFTQGRERILALGLDAPTVAENIIAVYRNVISLTSKRSNHRMNSDS